MPTVQVLGREAFHDTTLTSEVALLTGNWTHTVAFVGHNVPYQAMEVSTLIASSSLGVDPARVQRLVELLEVKATRYTPSFIPHIAGPQPSPASPSTRDTSGEQHLFMLCSFGLPSQVNPAWNLTTVSDGQRRRVQILCKLLKPCSVLLLDEITTDLDLLARQDLLTFLTEEANERGVSIVYCTHIFDGLDGFGTHIAYVSKGKMNVCKPMDALGDLLAVPAEQRARGWGQLFCAVQRALLDEWPAFREILQAPATGVAVQPPPGAAVCVRDMSWGYSGSATKQLNNLNFEIPRGSRCILTGANGAGKTTLLRLLGSKHMVPEGQVQVLGHNAFHDLCLNTMVSLLSGDWTRSVACVGNGIPFQADFSVGFMADEFAKALVRDGMDAGLVTSRMNRLVLLLDMDLTWRLHKVSDGQRRRAQLLLKLLRPSDLLLMDEVTTDLDVVSRQAIPLT